MKEEATLFEHNEKGPLEKEGPLEWFVCNAVGGDDDKMAEIMEVGRPIKVTMLVNGVAVDPRAAIKNLQEYADGCHGESIEKVAGDQFGEKLRKLQSMMDALRSSMLEAATRAGLDVSEEW